MPTIQELRQQPHWSYSALNTYLNMCSLKFAFQYIYRAESERTASNLPFGRAFHIAASHYAVSLMEGKRITPSELHEVFSQWFRAECAASVNVVYKANENIDTLTEHGKLMLSALLSNWYDWDNIISVAHAFKVQVPGLDKPLIGEYDLVIKDEEETTIVDWKTSAARWPEGKADKDFQTTAFSYAYLMESSQHTIPAFRFDVVTKAKNPSSEKHYTRRTEDDLNRFVRIAVAVEQAVKKEVFLPAETSFSCGDCQFGSACKEWHRKSAARHICLAA
jgi:putative RecB family exonuclease